MGGGGRFHGSFKHREVPQVEILPPPISVDRALALASIRGVVTRGSVRKLTQS